MIEQAHLQMQLPEQPYWQPCRCEKSPARVADEVEDVDDGPFFLFFLSLPLCFERAAYIRRADTERKDSYMLNACSFLLHWQDDGV